MRPNTAWKLSPGNFLTFPDDSTSPGRYRILRRKIITLMILVTVAPLSFLSFILYRHYKNDLANAAQRPLLALADKGKQTVDLFFKENLTAISVIASLHSYEEFIQCQWPEPSFSHFKTGGWRNRGNRCHRCQRPPD